MQRRPASIQVVSGDTSIDCLLFLWTITPGGGPGGERPSNERRIQITGMPGSEGFPLQPGVRTIVGGFHEETGTWAFWDSRRHSRFSQRSPSLQISAEALAQAEHDGIATHERPATSGREVVVAVRPDAAVVLGCPPGNEGSGMRAGGRSQLGTERERRRGESHRADTNAHGAAWPRAINRPRRAGSPDPSPARSRDALHQASGGG